MSNATLLTYDPTLLTPAMQDNPHHPAADRYVKSLQDIQKAIVAQSLGMNTQHVMAAKLQHRGMSRTDIAAELSHTSTWVGKTLKRNDAQRLTALLAYYQEAIDGPQEAQRRAMLWRISMDNEEKAPKVTISALAEMNKMDNIGKEAQASITTGDINIVIHQSLGRTGLDE
jgi:hypothetical protein